MRVLTVIPITNNPRIDELSYFSLRKVPLGSVVSVPIRGKEVPAMVVRSEDASTMKALLRSGNFTLKRIGVSAPKAILPQKWVQAAEYTAKYHATTVGAVIMTMVPKAILTNNLIVDTPTKDTLPKVSGEALYETYALQAPLVDRVAIYKNTVREAFAQSRSILLVTPTISTANSLFAKLSIGIENRVLVLTSKTTKKQLSKALESSYGSDKPVLLIATPKYATLFRGDVGTIIIEDESNSAYTTLRQPYIEYTTFLASYAKYIKAKLILAGTVLSSRVYLAMREGEIHELAPLSKRERSKIKVEILDVRKDKEDTGKKPFTAISAQLQASLTIGLKNKKRILILAPRRGLAPLTICRDCKTTVVCDSCDAPVTLQKKSSNITTRPTVVEDREFLCYKCGAVKDTDTTCSHCNSWRLETLGIGIERVRDELDKLYPKANIMQLDKRSVKTDKQITEKVAKFEKDGGILLATQIVLPYLSYIDITAVVSLDSMLSVPSFKIDEYVFSLLLKVRGVTKDTLYIQTRMPERSVLTSAATGDISSFMRNELALRKVLKYPPYTVMVKITCSGSKRQIIEDFKKIMPSLEPYGPRIFKQFHKITASKFALHALLRIDVKKYPNKELAKLLKSIQPMFEVKVGM